MGWWDCRRSQTHMYRTANQLKQTARRPWHRHRHRHQWKKKTVSQLPLKALYQHSVGNNVMIIKPIYKWQFACVLVCVCLVFCMRLIAFMCVDHFIHSLFSSFGSAGLCLVVVNSFVCNFWFLCVPACFATFTNWLMCVSPCKEPSPHSE